MTLPLIIKQHPTPPPGMTGILLCAAGLPVCLTRAPKPILHPPPVNKSDVKPVPGVPGVCRKTKKKHLKKSRSCATPNTTAVLLRTQHAPASAYPQLRPSIQPPPSRHLPIPTLPEIHPTISAGKNPEDVVRRYMQKVKNPPDEVSQSGGASPPGPVPPSQPLRSHLVLSYLLRGGGA